MQMQSSPKNKLQRSQLGKQSVVPSLARSGRGDGQHDTGGTSAPGLLSGYNIAAEVERNVVVTSNQKKPSPLRQNETLHQLMRNNQGEPIRQVYKVEGMSGDIVAAAGELDKNE